MTTLSIAEICAGYGGLYLAVRSLYPDAHLAWYAEIDRAACKVMERHHPDALNIGDITKDLGTLPSVDVIVGGTPCFAAGTPVLTHAGLRPIEQVKTGDFVWTHNARWRRVTATMSRSAPTVEFRKGFFCTPDHRLWLRRPENAWDSRRQRSTRVLDDPAWVPAEASQGMFAAAPRAVSPAPGSEVRKPERLSWWQIGRWVADGFYNKQVHVYLGKGKELDHEKHFPGWSAHPQDTALRITMPKSAQAGRWLTEHFGSGAAAKTIPAWLLAAEESVRREFLEGYWAGDGYWLKPHHTVKSASVSPCLTSGIELLARSLDYTCGVSYIRTSPTKMIQGRKVSQKPWWQVRATRNDGRFTESDANWMWFKLRSDPKQGPVQQVYDLTVDEDHSFVAAGIVVHNCQDLSVAGKGAGISKGTRSAIVHDFLDIVAAAQPRMVLWENVGAARSRKGEQPGETVLGTVERRLREAGYAVRSMSLKASDVGAPHRRDRVFVLGTKDAPQPIKAPRGSANPHYLLPTATVVDMGNNKTAEEWAAWTDKMRAKHKNGNGHGRSLTQEAVYNSGAYQDALAHWESASWRMLPRPVDLDGRLSTRFVEWMMGLLPGYVTETKGLSRTDKLRLLGNGVVPQQAAHALATLLNERTSA